MATAKKTAPTTAPTIKDTAPTIATVPSVTLPPVPVALIRASLVASMVAAGSWIPGDKDRALCESQGFKIGRTPSGRFSVKGSGIAEAYATLAVRLSPADARGIRVTDASGRTYDPAQMGAMLKARSRTPIVGE